MLSSTTCIRSLIIHRILSGNLSSWSFSLLMSFRSIILYIVLLHILIANSWGIIVLNKVDRTTCTWIIGPDLIVSVVSSTSFVVIDVLRIPALLSSLQSILHIERFSATKCEIILTLSSSWVISRLNCISFHIFLTTNKRSRSIYHCVSLTLGSNHRTHLFMLILMLFLIIKINSWLSKVNASQHHDIVLYQFDLLIFSLNVIQRTLRVTGRGLFFRETFKSIAILWTWSLHTFFNTFNGFLFDILVVHLDIANVY
jgi:hypothetical protein